MSENDFEEDLSGDDHEYGLVLPFVVCQTHGGKLDDQAFVVGYELGRIDAELNALHQPVGNGIPAMPGARYVHAAGVEQLDLIAMQYGYQIEVDEEASSPDWTWVKFKRQGSDDE